MFLAEIDGVLNVTDKNNSNTVSSQRQLGKLVVPLKKASESGTPYFVVSGLGGHVIPFQIVDKYVNDGWEGYGILYPGFVEGSSCGDAPTVEGYARQMLEEVLSVQPHGPYLLVGYSIGGAICLEMAQLLRARGEQAGVVLIDVKIYEQAKRISMISWAPIWLKWKLSGLLQRLSKSGKRAERRRREAQLYNGGREPEKMPESLSRVVRDGRKAADNYTPKKYDVPSVLIRCQDMIWYDRAYNWLPDYGWSKYVDMRGVLTSPGDHITIIKPPNTVQFAEQLKQALSTLLNGK